MVGEELNPLGRGLYRLSDVARYTGLTEPRVRSWFTSRSDRRIGSVFTADYPQTDGAHSVSFLDMVDAWIAGQLRHEGVTMPKIRAAHIALKQDLGTDHPFAHSSIYTDGRNVFSYAAERVNDPTLTEVVSRQTFFPRVRRVLKPIEYSARSHLAERWRIAKGVLIDPGLSFGQPVVAGTGVATYVVARSYMANKRNADLVARLFGITRRDVGDAVKFEERYGRLDAA
jgi:uncharacterized protein (DUF433 family)